MSAHIKIHIENFKLIYVVLFFNSNFWDKIDLLKVNSIFYLVAKRVIVTKFIFFYFLFKYFNKLWKKSPLGYVGRFTELTSGCVIGAKCEVTCNEVIPENSIIYGSNCERRIQAEKPAVSLIFNII